MTSPWLPFLTFLSLSHPPLVVFTRVVRRYGLGTIYYRQEKYDLAQYHFQRALSINPASSVLYCYLGMVLHANDRNVEALQMLQKSSELEKTNPQAQ